MKTRFVFVLTLLLLLPAGTVVGQSAPDTPPWRERLREAIGRATSDNPELRAMEARIEEARHRALEAAALPDPDIEVGIKDIPVADPSLSRSDFTMEMLTARQQFPGFGKRATRRVSAQAAAENV